jgi:hypothetical protein
MQKQLDGIAENLRCLQVTGLQGENSVETIILSCPIDSATALAHIASSIKKIYAATSACLGSNNTARVDNISWLQEQFEELIADSQYASSTELRRRRRRKGSGIRTGVRENTCLQNPLTTSLREARYILIRLLIKRLLAVTARFRYLYHLEKLCFALLWRGRGSKSLVSICSLHQPWIP